MVELTLKEQEFRQILLDLLKENYSDRAFQASDAQETLHEVKGIFLRIEVVGKILHGLTQSGLLDEKRVVIFGGGYKWVYHLKKKAEA